MNDVTAGDKPVVPVGDLVVGTIVPYASEPDAGDLHRQGWLACDGRQLSRADYAQLFAVIGTLHGAGDGVRTFNLPDYRGWFLRGVDHGAGRDPGAADRPPAAPGGHSGDQCGSKQGYATAMPKEAFELSEDGLHTHEAPHVPTGYSSYDIVGSHQAVWNENSASTHEGGEHRHELGGGDPESRPLNAYVRYLIKFRL
ncbi:MAG TPA: phage tail protein [Trebonia sp.]|nr:phage tail protein [Trebonia sp.]